MLIIVIVMVTKNDNHNLILGSFLVGEIIKSFLGGIMAKWSRSLDYDYGDSYKIESTVLWFNKQGSNHQPVT